MAKKTIDAEFEKMKAGPAYKALSPLERLSKLLDFKTFDELLEDGDIMDVSGVVAKTGYSRQHVVWLCKENKLDHFTRKTEGADKTSYFTFPDKVQEIFGESE